MRGLARGAMQSKYGTPKEQQKKKTSSIKPTTATTFIQTDTARGEGVDHVVLYKINTIGATQNQLRKLEKGAYSLSSIDGVESVTFGSTMTVDRTSQGYNYYLRIRLASVDHLKFYHEHPFQKQVHETCIDPLLVSPPLAVDCAAAIMSSSKSGTKMENTAFPEQQNMFDGSKRREKKSVP